MPTSKDLTDLESQVRKSTISAESFKRGSSMDPSKSILGIHKTISSLAGHLRKVVIRVGDLEKNVNNQFKKITSLKNISKTQSERISGENIGAKLPGGSTDNVNESLKAIADSLTSIADILAGRKKLTDATAAADRQKAEQDKRALAESKLEKRFDGLKKTAEKIIAPVKSILDRIIDFFVTVFLGRVVYKLLEWFGDPKNADKVKAIGRFLGDHWPKLLALYLVFGNAFGRFALGLAKGVAAGAVKLAFAIAKLLAAKKVKGAMGAAKFLGRGPGKLLANVVGTVATVGGAYALTQGMKGDDGGEQKTQNLAGGGYVRPRFPTFSGGGFNFKDMMGGAGLGAMFGPLGMMLGAGAGAVSGFVSGEKGVDKVPAMLSDGEFVMSRGAVAKYGVDTLESMNAAGGGTNKPKIMGGTTYAQGGGLMGENPDPNYKNPGQEKRLELMKALEEYGTNVAKSAGDLPLVKAAMNLASVLRGGGFKMPNIGGIKIPSEFGGGTIGDLGKQASAGVTKLKEGASGIQKYIQDTFNKIKSDPRVQKVGQAVSEIQKKLIKNGYLNEDGKLSGAAKNQATNFLSDLLPNLPFVNAMNKMKTESYLKSIGISKENAKYGDLAAQAMITGKSGVESAYNIGKMQLNKMSKESKKIYLDTLKERMASGTLKSGDLINPYGKVDKSDPRYREQGTVRFYVDPKTGKGYLLDTYGFDPGKVNLGGPGSAAQRQYEDQVKSFQDPKKKIKLGPLDIPIGQIAKRLDLKPMQDATEGGGLPQYILALRNKLFGYDTKKEGSSLDPKRFKTKAQIDELSELGDLKKFAAKQLTPAQRKLVDEKLKKAEIADKRKREEQKLGGGSVKLYDKPQKNTGEAYKSRFARPKNAGVKPVPPPVKPKPKITVVNAPGSGRRGAAPGRSNGSNVPNFGATSPKGGDAKAKTLGLGNRRGG